MIQIYKEYINVTVNTIQYRWNEDKRLALPEITHVVVSQPSCVIRGKTELFVLKKTDFNLDTAHQCSLHSTIFFKKITNHKLSWFPNEILKCSLLHVLMGHSVLEFRSSLSCL